MNIREEFDRLVETHRAAEDSIDYSDLSAVRGYLSEMLPIEKFLKTLYEMNRNVRHALWDFDEWYNEKSGFRYQFTNSNISVMRHFRYDTHIEHSHNFFQLNYFYSGGGVITVGSERIGGERGDFVLIAPKVAHNIEAFNDDCVIIKIHIRRSTFERTFFEWLSENNLLSEFFRQSLYGAGTGKYIVFYTGGDGVVRELIEKLYSEMTGHPDYYRIVGESLLTELFCRLVRAHADSSAAVRQPARDVTIGSLIGYIQTNYRKVTLDEAAEWSGYSKAHLCRIIKNSTGRTFTDILNGIRIDSAASLLSSTDMSVSSVAAHVGFNSDEHFHRMFRRFKGMTPGEFRAGEAQAGTK